MTKKPKRPPGRPRLGRTEKIEVRLTPAEKTALEQAARERGLTVADYVRLTLKLR